MRLSNSFAHLCNLGAKFSEGFIRIDKQRISCRIKDYTRLKQCEWIYLERRRVSRVCEGMPQLKPRCTIISEGKIACEFHIRFNPWSQPGKIE
jgi:hypothetical protein